MNTEETAWLLELSGPLWASFTDGDFKWTADANEALRFSRKEDAENFKASFRITAQATEHTWYNHDPQDMGITIVDYEMSE